MNTIILTTLIKGFARVQDLNSALNVFKMMKQSGSKSFQDHYTIRPNNVTFNSLIDCCIRCRKIEKAEEIFEEMKMQTHLQPDLITFSTMIKGFCKVGNIERALVLL